MSCVTVPRGIYFGFSKAELLEELERYKATVKQAGSDLQSSSVGGESFSYGPRRDMSLGQWSAELQEALALVDSNYSPAPTKSVVDMRS